MKPDEVVAKGLCRTYENRCKQVCPGCLWDAGKILRTIDKAGYRVVPVEPTEAMLKDARHHDGVGTALAIWEEMLDAVGQETQP